MNMQVMKRKIKRKVQELRFGLDSNERVLEVGSGHNPNARSDVLVDKYRESNEERSGKLETNGRPFYESDVCNLPFNDNEFDYVLAFHVMEHVDDPLKAANELERVAEAGYVVCPSLFWEIMRPTRNYHRWVVLQVDGKLLFYEKSNINTPVLGRLFEGDGLVRESLFARLFFRQYDEMFIVRHRWDSKLEVKVNPKNKYQKYFFEDYSLDKLYEVIEKRNIKGHTASVIEEAAFYIYNKIIK